MILEGSMLLFGILAAAMFIMRQIFIYFTLQEVKKKDEGQGSFLLRSNHNI